LWRPFLFTCFYLYSTIPGVLSADVASVFGHDPVGDAWENRGQAQGVPGERHGPEFRAREFDGLHHSTGDDL
jgi:hypothetical protein